LRRTCATLLGAQAKDPRHTQAQLRHADPTVTLRHYQRIRSGKRASGGRGSRHRADRESSQSFWTGSEQVSFWRRAGSS